MANHIVNLKYLRFVRSLPCCHCGHPEVHAHHIIAIGLGKTGGKAAPDICAMPLCITCHTAVHNEPKEYPQTRWMVETQVKAIQAGEL